MNVAWNDSAPIYRQLKDKVVAMMLDGVLKPGDALPSVRQVAAEYHLNPITVSRAYQELADEQLVEKRRGLGMYVIEGANARLLQSERERFLTEEVFKGPLVVTDYPAEIKAFYMRRNDDGRTVAALDAALT